MTDILTPKPPGRVRGRKGRSGKTTIAAASLLAGEAEALTRKASRQPLWPNAGEGVGAHGTSPWADGPRVKPVG